MEVFYLISIFIPLLFYLQVSMNYHFSQKYLSLLEDDENFNLLPLAVSFSCVCLFSALYYFSDVNNDSFGYYFLVLMFSVVLAKFFYFNSLKKFLGFKFPIEKIYLYLVIFYFFVSLYYLYAYSQEGISAFFDINSPELSDNILRKKLIPFDIIKTVKILFIPNYLFSFLMYLYLISVSYHKKEYLICFGVTFTMMSILYTNSYHVFHWTFWMPLNMVADLFEMIRLHQVQKEKIGKRVAIYKNKLNSVESLLSKMEVKKEIVKHDLNNKFSVALLNLFKVKTLLSKSEFENKDKVLSSIENARNATKQAANFLKETGLLSGKEIILKTKQVVDLFEIESTIELDALEGSISETKYDNILTNLIKNAFEANKEKSDCWIKLLGQQVGDHYRLKIIDSGLYSNIINPNELFKNGHTTKNNKAKHGFGLTSVLNDLESMGGGIKLVNYEGHTCFEVQFKTAKLS